MEIPDWQVWAALVIVIISFILIIVFGTRLWRLPSRKKIANEIKEVYDAKLNEFQTSNLRLQQEIKRLERELSKYKDNKLLSNTMPHHQKVTDDYDF